QVPRFDHAATLLPSGAVLITGGTNGTVFNDEVDIYLDGENFGARGFEFQLIPITMTAERARHSATLLGDGRVLVAGGSNGSGALGSAEIFDPTSKTFSSTPSLGARTAHRGLSVNAGLSAAGGRGVLVVGGRNQAGQALASAQIFLKPNG